MEIHQNVGEIEVGLKLCEQFLFCWSEAVWRVCCEYQEQMEVKLYETNWDIEVASKTENELSLGLMIVGSLIVWVIGFVGTYLLPWK